MAMSGRIWAIAPLIALSLTLAACQPGALAATTSAAPSPPASATSTPTPATSRTPTPTPSLALDTGAGPDPVGEPAAEPPPTPTSCAEIDASPLAEQWRSSGYVLEPFDGVIVGGSFPPADGNGGTLAVHCILWTADGAFGPHVLVELYRGADAAAAVAHPSLVVHSSALLATAHGEITLVDSSHEGVSSSQETVGGHGDALLRTFTVGMPLSFPEMTGPHARVLLFESVFGSALPAP